MQRLIMPNIVQEQTISSITEEATVTEAAQAMADANIAAMVVVNEGQKLIGIITERDITRRVAAKDLHPKSVKVGDIMTSDPDTLQPDDNAGDALELMVTRGYRHLPVVDQDKNCIGMVSIRDLYAAVQKTLEESIRETEAFVFGDRYSA